MGDKGKSKPLGGFFISLAGVVGILGKGITSLAVPYLLTGGLSPYGLLIIFASLLVISGAVVGYFGNLKLGGVLVITFSLPNLVLALDTEMLLSVLLGITGGVLILIGK